VAVIVGLSAGVVLALVAGARRTDDAVERFLAGANPHQQLVVSGIPGTFDFAEVDVDEVAALPQVRDSQRAVVLAATGRTDEGRLVDSSTANFFADPSGRIGHELDRFKVLDGRLADPSDPREVVAVFRAAEQFGLDVGDTIDVNLLDGEELGTIFSGGASFGDLSTVEPRERFTVTGIVVEAGVLAPPAPDDTATLWLTPAAAERFGDAGIIDTVLVQLEGGAAAEPAFLEALGGLGGGRPVFSQSTTEDARTADRGLTPIVRALHLAAVLVAVVTALITAQVLSRQAVTESSDDHVLRALGWTRRDLLRLRLAKAATIGVGAMLVAAATAVVLSPVFPIGLARLVEPDPGFSADLPVLGLGVAGVLVAVTGLGALTGWRDLHRAERTVWPPSRVVSTLSAAGSSPAFSVGSSLALQSGSAGTAPPVVSVGTTVALGLGTVAAVLAFMASLHHLRETPPLYGWNWDVELGQEFSSALTDADVDQLSGDPAVQSLAVGSTATVSIDGERSDVYAVDDVVGRLQPSLLDGRRAESTDEVVLGPDVADIGDTVTVTYGEHDADFEVVGHAAVPRSEGMMTFTGLQRVTPDVARQTALVDLREGADLDAFLDRTVTGIGYTGQDVATPELPDDLVNFGRADAAPAAVASAMSFVAVATLVHGLATTVRRRRVDLAVLRALGLTRRQVLATVAWQAGLIVVAAAVVAVPVGVVAGRWGWIVFADELKVIARPIVPLLALLGAAAAAVVLAEAVALAAGNWSARRSTAAALRAE